MRKASHISYSIVSKGTVVQPDEIFYIVDQMSPLCQPGGEYHIFFCFTDGGTVGSVKNFVALVKMAPFW